MAAVSSFTVGAQGESGYEGIGRHTLDGQRSATARDVCVPTLQKTRSLLNCRQHLHISRFQRGSCVCTTEPAGLLARHKRSITCAAAGIQHLGVRDVEAAVLQRLLQVGRACDRLAEIIGDLQGLYAAQSVFHAECCQDRRLTQKSEGFVPATCHGRADDSAA